MCKSLPKHALPDPQLGTREPTRSGRRDQTRGGAGGTEGLCVPLPASPNWGSPPRHPLWGVPWVKRSSAAGTLTLLAQDNIPYFSPAPRGRVTSHSVSRQPLQKAATGTFISNRKGSACRASLSPPTARSSDSPQGSSAAACHLCALLEGPGRCSPREAPETQKAEVSLVGEAPLADPMGEGCPSHKV